MKLEYVGADPEVFLKCKKTGKFISGYGFLPGTKAKPHPVEFGAVQKDGMAAEFNITPASSAKEFIHHVSSVLGTLSDMVSDHATLHIDSAVTFDRDVWDQTPEEAKELGCDPDYNAYTGAENTRPVGDVVPFRTAAGHIHLGWTKGVDPFHPEHFEACRTLVRELDFHLGVPLAFMDAKETSVRRKILYGKPGAFRPKSYGVEYRVPSNFWIQDTQLMEWVFNTCHKVFDNLVRGRAANNSDQGYPRWSVSYLRDAKEPLQDTSPDPKTWENHLWFNPPPKKLIKHYVRNCK